MGRRGPLPSSGRLYHTSDGTDHDVVIGAQRAPYIHWPGHPLATSRGYVPVLRLAASDAGLGRDHRGSFSPLVTRGQTVQPFDGNPWNWARSNLRVRELADSLPPAPKISRSPNKGSGSARQPPKAR